MNANTKNPGAMLMKSENQRAVLNLLRRRGMSRAELAALTGLTRSCITFLVDDLLEKGLVRETAAQSTGIGRHPITLEIVPDARFVAGVNIRRHAASVGFVDLSGRVLAEETLPNDGVSPAEQTDKITETILSLQHALNLPDSQVLGIGACAPGPLDYRTGQLLTPPNFKAWHMFPLAQQLSGKTGFSVHVENVSSAMAIREWFFGQARQMDNFMVMQVNEGIGAGIVSNGSLYRGAGGMGCEIGHSTIHFRGKKCVCGNRGCLETYASIPALLKDSRYSQWREAVDAFPAPDAEALLSLEASYLAAAIVNAVNLFDLKHIILMGDIAYRPEPLQHLLSESVSRCVIAREPGGAPTLSFDDQEALVCDGAMACLYSFFIHEPQRS